MPDTEASIDPALAAFILDVGWKQGSSANKSKPQNPANEGSSVTTNPHDTTKDTDSAGTNSERGGYRKLTRLQIAAGMRERELTDDEVAVENMERNAKARERLLAQLQKDAGDQEPGAAQIPSDKVDTINTVSGLQADTEGKQPKNENVVSNTSQASAPSEPQEDNTGKQTETKDFVKNTFRPPASSQPQEERTPKAEHKRTAAPNPPQPKHCYRWIKCPECHVLLQITLTSFSSDSHVHGSSTSAGPRSYKPTSSRQAGESSSSAGNGQKRKIYPYPPRITSEPCQNCWEMLHNQYIGVDPATAPPTPMICCGVTCGCLDILLETSKEIFGACFNALKLCGSCAPCWKVVENLPVIKEWRKKREVRRGKRADRSGGGNADEEGIELQVLGDKDMGKEKQSAGAGGLWESGQGQEAGEGSGDEGAGGDGNGGSDIQAAAEGGDTGESSFIQRARADGNGGPENQAVVTNGGFDGGHRDGEPMETEYDRKRAEDAQKSLWQRLAGVASSRGRGR